MRLPPYGGVGMRPGVTFDASKSLRTDSIAGSPDHGPQGTTEMSSLLLSSTAIAITTSLIVDTVSNSQTR